MPDHAISADAAVQTQLDRLWSLSPGADVLGLERIAALLARLGNPERRLPPVFHVAGTNGKGSTCAFLRAALEAAGYRLHVYTSPHLVRFNERIRLAGTLIGDDALTPLLARVLDVAEGVGASFFEVTTAAAFLAFAETPADACVIEVGLGGRLDATNVLPAPAVCGIAALGMDHEAFLGNSIEGIAAEKAGIAKPGVPLVTMRYPATVAAVIAASAAHAGAALVTRGTHWDIVPDDAGLKFHDRAGSLSLPRPTLPGEHQAENLGLATAMLRHQQALPVPDAAITAAALHATWPARLQRLAPGPLTGRLPQGAAVWVDGGHNPSAGAAIAAALDGILSAGRGEAPRLALVLGMLANKDIGGFLAPFASRIDTLIAVPVAGHDHHAPAKAARVAAALGVPRVSAATTIPAALDAIAKAATPATVLIAGSLYLAGVALSENGEPPI